MEILACPHCDRLFNVTPAVLGKKIRCRRCQGIFHVPRDTTSVPLGPAIGASEGGGGDAPPPVAIAGEKGGQDVRSCPACGRTFAMKPSLVGKTIRCRGCKALFCVTATVDRQSNVRHVPLPAAPPVEREEAKPPVQPPAPPLPRRPPVPRIAPAMAAASPRPTVFEDIGDVIADLQPGERIASVVRPRNAATLAKPEHEAIATLIAIVLGGACALPAVQLILWWAFDKDPLMVGESLPDFLEWIAPPRWRN